MLADLPPDWEMRTLASLTSEITSGGTPQSGNSRYYTEDGIPFAKIDDLTRAPSSLLVDTELHITPAALRESTTKVFPAGTVLVSMYGTIGLVKTLARPIATNQALAALLAPFGCEPTFLTHALDYHRDHLVRSASQTTQANISASVLKAFKLAVPESRREQRRIAEILDAADAAIGETEALIAKLKRVKTGLMYDLLTRGLDERGGLRDPDDHPEQFKDLPLGRIPREWEITTIDSIAVHVGSGLTPRGGVDVYKPQGVIFIRSQNVTFAGLKLDDVAYIDSRTHESMKRSEVCVHDVLLNITGASIGRCCPLPSGLGPANVNQHVCAIRLPQPDNEDATFLSSILASHIGQNQIDRLNAGGNRQGLNYQQLRAFVVPWAPKKERARIAAVLDVHDDRIRAEEAYRDKLKLQKAGLMEDLLTGRIRVNTAQEVSA